MARKPYSIKLSEDIWIEIEKIAKEKQIKRSEVIKRILIRELVK